MNNFPPPTSEPISLQEARKQCRIDPVGSPPSHPDDELLLLYISAAREYAEEYTGAAIGQRLLEMALDAFPTGDTSITLPVWPALGIASISYLDPEGNELLVPESVYQLDAFATPRRIVLSPDQVWPEAGVFTNGIRITYVVGYSAPDESPQDSPMPRAVKVALLLIIGHLYKNREASQAVALQSIPLGASTFLDTQRLRMGFA